MAHLRLFAASRLTKLIAATSALVLAATSVWASPAVASTNSPTTFTIAIMPDTQGETHNLREDTRFADRTEWLADRANELNLKFVGHTGDITNWGWLDKSQISVARLAMLRLERAQIPYAISLGNHDTRAVGHNNFGPPGNREYGGSAYVNNPECLERLGPVECDTPKLVRHTEEFNARFKTERYGNVVTTYQPNKIDNIYSRFSAGGRSWGVLTLELWPRDEVIEWARQVVAANPNDNIIVQTHSYLTAAGEISTSNGGYGANAPSVLYQRVISQYPNVKMVFSGHTGQAASRVDTGVKGNRIVSILTTLHSQTNPVRLVEIDTQTNTVQTRVYAPNTDQQFPQYNTTTEAMAWVG